MEECNYTIDVAFDNRPSLLVVEMLIVATVLPAADKEFGRAQQQWVGHVVEAG